MTRNVQNEMSDREALIKAIEMAIANGWQAPWRNSPQSQKIRVGKMGKNFGVYVPNDDSSEFYFDLNLFLFDHDFAKALWGEAAIELCMTCHQQTVEQCTWDKVYGDSHPESSRVSHTAWKYHIQQLARAEDRIKYLKENLPNV